MRCIRYKPNYFARKLQKAMKGLGTDDQAVVRIVVSRCESDMVQIKTSFQEQFKTSLADWIKVGGLCVLSSPLSPPLPPPSIVTWFRSRSHSKNSSRPVSLTGSRSGDICILSCVSSAYPFPDFPASIYLLHFNFYLLFLSSLVYKVKVLVLSK